MTGEDALLLSCDPTICGLGRRPHRHCSCGLPMSATGATCALCMLEEPRPVHRPAGEKLADPLAWDGHSFPSRRGRRVGHGGLDAYRLLICAVLRPDGPDYLRLGGDRVHHLGGQAAYAGQPLGSGLGDGRL